MNPKKVKNLLPAAAVKNKEDITLLQKLNIFYWGKVREILSTTDEVNVEILNLGQFTRKHWNIDKKIKKYQAFYEIHKDSSRKEVVDQIQKELNHLLRMRAAFIAEESRKLEKKQIRYEYNKTMEEQRSDSRRS